MQALDHINVVGLFESFLSNDEDQLYIIMEFADGGCLETQVLDLADKRKSSGLDVTGVNSGSLGHEDNLELYISEHMVRLYLTQIVMALEHCHDANILHRDLKTENIFMMKDGTVKLGDFGLGRQLSSSMSMAESRVGTPFFFSPELVNGLMYDNKSDIWSVGCIAYQLCALNHAFYGANFADVTTRIASVEYPPLPPHYSEELRDMLEWIFQESPAQRPTATQLLEHDCLVDIAEALRSGESVADIAAEEVDYGCDSAGGVVRTATHEPLVMQQLCQVVNVAEKVMQAEKAAKEAQAKVKEVEEALKVNPDGAPPTPHHIAQAKCEPTLMVFGGGQMVPRVFHDIHSFEGCIVYVSMSELEMAFVTTTGKLYSVEYVDGHSGTKPKVVDLPTDDLPDDVDVGLPRLVCVGAGGSMVVLTSTHYVFAREDLYGSLEVVLGLAPCEKESDLLLPLKPGRLPALDQKWLTSDQYELFPGACKRFQSVADRAGDEEDTAGYDDVKDVIVSVSCSQGIFGASSAAGYVYMWGDGQSGAMGNDHFEDVEARTPVIVPALKPYLVLSLACGGGGAVAVVQGGKVFGWGAPGGVAEPSPTPTPLNVAISEEREGGPIVAVQGGEEAMLLLSDKGRVYSFGKNNVGQCGLGKGASAGAPALVNNFTMRGVSLSAGAQHGGVVTDEGSVYIWGKGEFGRLGMGDKKTKFGPTVIGMLLGNGDSRSLHLACGFERTAVLYVPGVVIEWGDDDESSEGDF